MSTVDENMQKHIGNIQGFADEHQILFEKFGEIGFGRPCVGLLKGQNYIAYNPISLKNYRPIGTLYDDRLADIAPGDAYHKSNYVVVLGHGNNAIRQLSEWVDKLRELDVKLVEYETGATSEIQFLFMGVTGLAFKVGKRKKKTLKQP
jgi:hypothetical protein